MRAFQYNSSMEKLSMSSAQTMGIITLESWKEIEAE